MFQEVKQNDLEINENDRERILVGKQKTNQQQNFWVNFTSRHLFLGTY